MNNEPYDQEQLGYIVIIYLLLQSAEYEWNNMRELACDEINKTKIDEYFTKVFAQNYNEEIIPANSHFFRARQIKRDDANQLGVNKIQTEEFKLLQKECDDINASNRGITISFSDFLLIKSIFNDDQRQELISIMTPLLNELKDKKFLGFNSENSGLPPKDKRKEGRLNTVDDDFLYLSYDYETTLAEMRPIINQEYSVAECETTKELKIVNLHKSNAQNEENLLTNFYLISKKVSEPNTEPNPQNESFYKITQMLAHFFKSKGYDGISFGSSILENGVNLVLFDEKNVKFVGSKIFRIKSIKVE
ncbi:MAG: RES domain-containing protein [Prevotella sp.]|nr:RES domain-containing protein [Staphylococcus sp.]MCM1349572.1 RES domain-containing protein [Prevotella sp.]